MAAREPDADERRGTKLQRIQIIKVWIDEQGLEREKIFEVAGHPDNGATVNRDTCEPRGNGFDELCAVWTDPDFNPSLPAVYYARVVENPVCSWRQRDCNTFASDAPNRPAACDTLSEHRMVIQERAVTSPVHYSP